MYASFASTAPGSQIFAVDPSGGSSIDLSGAVFGDDAPAVSPGGDKIAFRHGGAIWVMDIDGGGRHQVGGMGSEDDPSWSPDGTSLLFTTDARPDGFSFGGPNVWTMRADGTTRVQLTNDASSREPVWAPSGSKIAFVSSRNGNQEISTMNGDGTGAVDITGTANVDESDPDWSPDGTLLAYKSTNLAGHGPGTVGPDLWTMASNGSNQVPLIHHQYSSDLVSDGASPAWSPDGTQIAFAANNGTGGVKVWRVAAGGGVDVQVTAEPGNPGDQQVGWARAMTSGLPTLPPAGSKLTPLSPSRVWDSRGGPGPVGQVGAGQTRSISVTGVGGVPASGVTAVVLNVTAVGPSAATYVTVWPAGEAQPLASNLNVPAGDVRPNLVVVKVGAGGQVSFNNAAGALDLIADVAGYYGT